MKKNKYEIDMCNGTLMDKLISFAIPLMLSGILQLMFNAVDIIVVGRFSGSQSLAAVGSTTRTGSVVSCICVGMVSVFCKSEPCKASAFCSVIATRTLGSRCKAFSA